MKLNLFDRLTSVSLPFAEILLARRGVSERILKILVLFSFIYHFIEKIRQNSGILGICQNY